MRKKEITENLSVYIDLENSFSKIREQFDEIETNFPDHYCFRVDIYHSDYDGLYVSVYAKRMETDVELAQHKKRSEEAKISKAKAEATRKVKLKQKELKMLEKLEKKYRGKNAKTK